MVDEVVDQLLFLMMKHLILLIILSSTGATFNILHAQSDQLEVRKVINRLFDGMRAGDSTMVKDVFYDDAFMVRVGDQGLSTGSVDPFVEAVGAPHDEVWDERIWNVHISVDGRLASAWMEFAFFLGDQMSHCGVNSMQLYRTEEGWKIFHLADTRRPPTCEPPYIDP